MKKIEVKVEMHGDKEKQKAMKAVSSLSGIDSIAVDMKEKKMTVVGEVDPVEVIYKIRKLFHAEIISVGPAKEEKKEENKKDDQKKESVNLHLTHHYISHGASEDPNACAIS